jgi:hypothetical protein
MEFPGGALTGGIVSAVSSSHWFWKRVSGARVAGNDWKGRTELSTAQNA